MVHAHDSEPQRLSQIATIWSVVQRAHGSQSADARAAREQLIQRYGPAIRRYLLGALRDQDLADEAFQEFSLQLVEGRFQIADPERGRFRSLLKTILFRLVAGIHRKRQRDRLVGVDSEFDLPDEADNEAAFDDSWRNHFLTASWESLRKQQEATGRPFFSVLKLKVERPGATSAQLAEQLSADLSRPFSEAHFRVQLFRAREVFASRLFDEIIQSLDVADSAIVEEELAELQLLDYCRPAFDKWKTGV